MEGSEAQAQILRELFSLEGRTVLITGASSGLGQEFARFVSGLGARVLLAARRIDRLEALAAQLHSEGGEAHAFALDVSDPGGIASALTQAASIFGPPDILINNAGIAKAAPALELESADWDRLMDVNLRGVFFTAQAVARQMVAAKSEGAIVNIASLLAHRPLPGLADYAAAKAGVAQLTRVLALEWARHRIRVNALLPGYVQTDINREFLDSPAGQAMREKIPQRRFGQPQDLLAALATLIGPGGAWITGSLLTIDGGHDLAGTG